MKYAIIEISGGIGKNIMATAVVSNIKQQYPDRQIVVIAAYPELYLYNPNVYRVFKFGSCPYFYNDYVKDKDCLFLCAEPYRASGYLKQDRHLVQAWCEANDIVYTSSKGQVLLNSIEISKAKSNINTDKPLFMFQPNGGAVEQPTIYSWNRDIPFEQACQIADALKDKYHLIQPIHEKQTKIPGCEHITWPLRDLFALFVHCQGFIGIDSFLQHLANCYDIPGTALWISNSPTVFGYDIHTNITPDPSKYIDQDQQLIDGYFHGYDFSGSREYDYPFIDSEIFDVSQIVSRYL